MSGQEYLSDVNKNGKEIDWKGKKVNVNIVSDSYDRIYKKYSSEIGLKYHKMINNFSKKSLKLKDCGIFLEYKVYKNKDEKKLHKANFCKIRLCPMCSWRRSLKIFGQVSQVMNVAKTENNCSFIFLTLTVKNCSPEDLKDQLSLMYKAFNKLMLRKDIKKMNLGWFRALEVTFNKETNTYHPHFHIMLMVKTFYAKNKNLYLDQSAFTELWKKSLQVDYTPIVNIQAVKVKKGKTIETVVAEIAKYTVKETDLIIKDSDGVYDLELQDANIEILDQALAFRRLTAFGGKLKAIHKLLNLCDVEKDDLVLTDNDDLIENPDLDFVIERYYWNIGFSNYVKIKENVIVE